CIDSIKQKTTYENYELIIVDNNSIEPETIKYISELDCIKIKYKENFNFSKINNLAASYANGDYIVFLNNDIEIITDDWIQSMLEHAQRKEVGAVGCKLLYPDGTIQHAGVILGLSPDPMNMVAGHIFIKLNNVDHGYFGLIDTIRNYSAVTAAAMMVRKSVFDEVGGFDNNI
ncbi:MAG: glycosyltransferase, partial [Bacteroidales bacterium]|nr:glycosyltransferase [Bacteroidales bacterium]